MKNNRVVLLTVFLALVLSCCTPSPASTTVPPIATTVATSSPSQVSPTATFTPQASATATGPGIGSTWVRPADGMTMVYVPQGEFNMGGTAMDDEKPVHKVYLDAYWIDQTEVTTAMYAQCVQAGVCQKPDVTKSWTRDTYYGDPQYANYPVIMVRWGDAKAYCNWAGARLPTEAEWEKAATGPMGKIYPWGSSPPMGDFLNFNNHPGDTITVGSYPLGASPYGALDMAGNVWEFVSDWSSATYYAESPYANPQGPSSGIGKVIRGGSYNSESFFVQTHLRNSTDMMATAWDIGFRCARSANAVAGPTPSATPGLPTLADFFKRCPTAAEVADVDAKLKITFENDPTTGTLVCTAAAGSADFTKLQMRAYQTIIIMKYLQFSKPLPWTSKQLYDWFTGAVKGVDFNYSSGDSSCCNHGIISIKVHPESFILTVDEWATGIRGAEMTTEPGTGGSWGPGLMDSTSVLIHEARHNEDGGYPHICGNNSLDNSLSEMGAYALQYYFYVWLADYSDRTFLRAPGEDPNVYLETAMYRAYEILKYEFCNDPTPTPGPIPTIMDPIINP